VQVRSGWQATSSPAAYRETNALNGTGLPQGHPPAGEWRRSQAVAVVTVSASASTCPRWFYRRPGPDNENHRMFRRAPVTYAPFRTKVVATRSQQARTNHRHEDAKRQKAEPCEARFVARNPAARERRRAVNAAARGTLPRARA